MRNIEEVKNDVTERVVDKVAKEITSLVVRNIREIGEITADDFSLSINVKGLKISLDSDNTDTHEDRG